MTYQPDRSYRGKVQHEADPYEILGPGDTDREDEEQGSSFADEPLPVPLRPVVGDAEHLAVRGVG